MTINRYARAITLASLAILFIVASGCIVEPDIPYDEYPIWLVTYPGIGVHKLSRQLETIFDIRESGSGFTPLIAVNPADKNVWFKSASNEITVYDENWHHNYGPITIGGVSAIKINDSARRVWIMAGDDLYIYSFTGNELGGFTVNSLNDFTPIEDGSGIWCLTGNGYYLNKYSDSGELQKQLIVPDFYSGNAAKLFYDPGDNGIWISSNGTSDNFVKVDGDGTVLATVATPDSEVTALNRSNGDVCYVSGGDTAGVGLVDNAGATLWFTEVTGVSAATIGETDDAVLYTTENDDGHILYHATRAEGKITHFAGPYSADTILIAATGEVYGE